MRAPPCPARPSVCACVFGAAPSGRGTARSHAVCVRSCRLRVCSRAARAVDGWAGGRACRVPLTFPLPHPSPSALRPPPSRVARGGRYAVENVFRALRQDSRPPNNLVRMGAYLLGEFGHLVAAEPGMGADVQFRTLQAQWGTSDGPTRALLLSTYVKVGAAAAGCLPLSARLPPSAPFPVAAPA